MGSVLLVTSEMAGRINMMCELARRLTAAGHTAAVTSPVDIRPRVEAQGVRYVPLATTEPPAAAVNAPPPPEDLARRALAFVRRLAQVRTIAARRQRKVTALRLDEWEALLAAEAPDLVLIDIELPAHVMSAAARDVPLVVWTSMLSLWKRRGLPPLGSPIVPGRGRQGSRLGIEWAWIRFRLGRWLRRQRLRITRIGEDQVSVLRRVAAECGFPFRAESDLHQWLIPFTYRTLPTISFNARELEFPHEPPPNLTYVGPMLSRQGRAHPDLDESTRPRLEALYERRRTGRSEALIYCSFGAWHKGDDRRFLRRVVDAVAERPGWDVVIGLGSRLDPADLGPLPANVHPVRWAPQVEILAHADCAVHHGGISSVNECIVHGVPMVLYPFDFMDQPGNAARVSYHGIGDVGDRETDDVATIRKRIEGIMGDPEVAVRLEALGGALATYEAAETAVAYVARALANGGDHQS